MPRTSRRKNKAEGPEFEAESKSRMQTRATNATTHPGHILLESGHSHRTKEEILEEKKQKQARKDAEEKKQLRDEAWRTAGNAYIERLDISEAAATANAERDIPRHRNKAKKKTGKVFLEFVDESPEPEGTPPRTKPPKVRKWDRSPSRESSPSLKKSKVKSGQPLRRTETTLEDLLTQNMNVTIPLKNQDKPMITSDSDVPMETQDESTPRPRKTRNKSSSPAEIDVGDDEHFRTPHTLKPTKTIAFSDLSDLSGSEESGETRMQKKQDKSSKELNVYDVTTIRHSSNAGKRAKETIPYIDLSQLTCTTALNATVASGKAATFKSVASVSTSKVVAKSTVGSVSQTAAQSKSTAAKSKSTAAQSKSAMPHSKSQSQSTVPPKSKSVAPQSKAARSTPQSESTASHTIPSKQISQVTQGKDQISDSEFGVGGMSDEDDSREQELALSSPLKGNEARAKSILKVKVDQDAKARKRATIQNLPAGANTDSEWTRLVIPNFIRLLMAGEQPWLISDDVIISELQQVWDHVYGEKIQFMIMKGTVPFELATQKIYDYRSRIAYKAICAVSVYLYDQCDADDDGRVIYSDMIALAKDLIADRTQFLFKGMENRDKPVKKGTFQHTLILETLTAHFTMFTQSQPLRGLEIGEPLLTLALAAAAVERALELTSRGLVVESTDSRGRAKMTIEKVYNPGTGVVSQISTEFSALGWNKATMEYLNSVKKLGVTKLKAIFEQARNLVPQNNQEVFDPPQLSSGRAMLCSDDEDW